MIPWLRVRGLQLIIFMNKNMKIYVAGHLGMVGSAIVRTLKTRGYKNILVRNRQELDLLNQAAVLSFLVEEKPSFIFIAAAKVGGILANDTLRADFIYQNLQIECNLIHGAHQAGIDRLLFLGSSCVYPREAPQPILEKYLLSGPLESTNEPYAVAKIAGIKLCESYNRQFDRNFFTVMPTNLYGKNDNYDLNNSHVMPALIRKAHEAKKYGVDYIEVWGTGEPRREFLFVDDLADASVFLMEQNELTDDIYNIGVGADLSIKCLVQIIMNIVGYSGGVQFDKSKQDGTPRKLLDSSRISQLGWSPKVDLESGIKLAYQDYLESLAT